MSCNTKILLTLTILFGVPIGFFIQLSLLFALYGFIQGYAAH